MVPIVTVLLDGRASTSIGAVVLAALIVWRHRANLSRLAHGTESRIGTRGVKVRRRGPFVG